MRTCDVFQKLGKEGKLAPAQLINLPLIDEPWSRIACDIIGTLPISKEKNRFILTVICMSTHFPEAIPLRRHTAVDVAHVLAEIFSRY